MKLRLAALSLAMLLSSLGTSIANVALPSLADAFDASFHEVQWIVLAYLVAITTLIVSAGRLGDVIGRRRLLLSGIALFTIASALCAAAPTLPLLIAARAAQGLGSAIMMALAMALVGETVPKEKTGTAMGLLGTTSAIGTALGPSLGGILLASLDWRAIFFVNVPLGLAALAIAWHSLPIADRSTTASPVMRLSLFRNPVLRAGFAMSILVTSVVMATLIVGPFYLSRSLALDAARVGLVMSCGPIVAALTGVPAGRFVDRFGAQRMTVAGLGAMIAGSSIMLTAPASIPAYIVPLAILTAGYALFQAANNTAVMTDVRADQRGVVSGLLNLSRNLGLIAGTSLMGALFAAGGMRLTFAAAAGLIAIALGIASATARRPIPIASSPAVM